MENIYEEKYMDGKMKARDGERNESGVGKDRWQLQDDMPWMCGKTRL